MMKLFYVRMFVVLWALFLAAPVWSASTIGWTRAKLFKRYPFEEARTYRKDGNQEWITYHDRRKDLDGTITFQLEDDVVKAVSLDDRKEVVREYLGEFCSRSIAESSPKLYSAIVTVMEGLPQEVFMAVTDRRRPIVFTEYYHSGLSRFANSSDIRSIPGEPLAFAEGFTLIKLSDELQLGSEEAIAGVVAHEIAHRYLEHFSKPTHTCDMEREANRQIKAWGFEAHFEAARERFGAKERDGNEKCKEKS